MQTKAENSLDLMTLTSFPTKSKSGQQTSQRGFYQQIALDILYGRIQRSRELFDLAQKLLIAAEQALQYRQLDAVKEMGSILIGLPLPYRMQMVGEYYLGTALLLEGDIAKSKALLGRAVSHATPRFRARATLNLASSAFYAGDFGLALCQYAEASAMARHEQSILADDPLTVIQAQRMTNIIMSIEGEHASALNGLTSISGLVRSLRSIYPHEYCAHKNSIAVELLEVGRIEEARAASQIALASPYAIAYPDWLETGDEIKRRGYRIPRPSVIISGSRELPAINLEQAASKNVIPLPIERSLATNQRLDQVIHSRKSSARPIGNFAEWQSKMAKTKTNETKRSSNPEPKDITRRVEKQKEIMNRVLDEGTTDQDLDQFLEYLDEIQRSTRKEQ